MIVLKAEINNPKRARGALGGFFLLFEPAYGLES